MAGGVRRGHDRRYAGDNLHHNHRGGLLLDDDQITVCEGVAMTLYEPVTATWVLISVLILAFSGELLDVFFTKHDRDCHASNETLLREGGQGPLRDC